MKTLFVILLLWSVALSGTTDCFGEYTSLIAKIERSYKWAQTKHETSGLPGQYTYRLFPVSVFPFFCLSKEKTPDLSKYSVLYLCGCSTNIYVRTDSVHNDHATLAVLQYVRLGRITPYDMTYSLYFYSKNKFIQEWIEEKKPLKVYFTWNSTLQQYISR